MGGRGDPFPRNPDEFELDERCSFSRFENKWTLVDINDEEWEWNTASGSWFQPATEEQIAAYQQAYGGPVPEDNGEATEPNKNKRKKTSSAAANGEASNKKPKVLENRAIFISNLPVDATVDELAREFGKYGMIDRGNDGDWRIKLYTDDDGNFKGEALIVYYKREAIFTAIDMADNYWFRPGDDSHVIHVKEADMSYKRQKDGDVKMDRKNRKAHEQKRAEMIRKLAEWSDDDEIPKEVYAPKTNKWAKFVIMNHMFTLKELEDDPDAIPEIKDEVREDAEKYGTVTKVVLYDLEAEGIVGVRFADANDAENFKNKCNGRIFDGRKVEAWQPLDRPKYKKSKTADAEPEDDD